MKNRSRQRGIGAAVGEDADEVLRLPRPAARDHRNVSGLRDGLGERAIEAVLHAIGVHRREQNFAGAERFAARGPLDGVDPFVVAPAAGVDVPFAGRLAPRVDGQYHGLRAEFVGEFGDQFRTADRGGVDGDFVGAGEQNAARIGHRTDASADRQRNEDLARGAGHHAGHDFAGVARRGDVEEDEFVGAVAIVTVGEFDGVARIAQVDEVHTFDDTAAGDIQTGDDALG